jgi:anaerobic magnesium-protoporphyrin IX monomethyl ester cyclase
MAAPVIVLLNARAEPDYPDPTKVLGLPLAILTLARVLLPAGYDVRLVDENVTGRPEDRLAAMPRPLMVGISCLGGGQIPSGLRLARIVRRRWPGVPLVWGGWSPTMLPHLYEAEPLVDVVVRGRGEAPLLALAERLAAGRDADGIPGISWRDANGVMRRNPETGADDAPAAAEPDAPLPYHLVAHWDRYLTAFGTLNYHSSRGCPHRCTYCGIPTQDRTFQARDNERVVEDLSRTPALGIDTIVFFDDNFFTSKERVLDLAQRLVESGLGLTWHSNGRLDQVEGLDDSELALLRRSGCASINIGYETGDQAVAERVHKDVRCADMVPLAARLQAAGIGLSINVMVGLPGETPERLVASMDTLMEIHAAHQGVEVAWYMFMPAPGTPAWQELVADGLLTEPATLAEHMRLQSMYLEHPWYYERAPRDVLRDDRTELQAIAWCFHQAFAAPPPKFAPLRPAFHLRRRLCRWRWRTKRFGFPVLWRVHFLGNALRTRCRWALARLSRRRAFSPLRRRLMARARRTRIPGVRPV